MILLRSLVSRENSLAGESRTPMWKFNEGVEGDNASVVGEEAEHRRNCQRKHRVAVSCLRLSTTLRSIETPNWFQVVTSDMHPVFQNAHKLFVRFSKRNFSVRTSTYNVTRSSHFQDQVHCICGNEDDNVVSWTLMISNFVKRNQPQKAIELFKKMLTSNLKPNYVTVLSSIRASSCMDSENLTMGIHCFAIKMGFGLEMPIITALLGFYSVWDMEAAWKLFLQAPEKDFIMWSAMISAFVKIGEYILAIDLFKEMQFCGVLLNYVCILSILPACANLGNLRIGREVHGFSIKRSFTSHVNVQNSLVDMYTNQKISMLGVQCLAYAQSRANALAIFKRMKQLEHGKPNEFAFP
nr:pentatricopeptide repeat-containing protein At4g33990-like [Ipomoea batatas]